MRNLPAGSIKDILVFLAAADHMSFSEAGRTVGLPPSSISRRIAAFEDRLGVPLFLRSTRQIALTEEGREYARRMKAVVGELRDAEAALSSQACQAAGNLRVLTKPGLSTSLLAPLLGEFSKRYPNITIQLNLTSDDLDTLPANVDVGLRYGVGKSSSIITKKLTGTRQFTFAGVEYLRSNPALDHPDELVNHKCLTFGDGSTKPVWRYRDAGQFNRSIVIAGTLNTNDVNALAVATAKQMGVCVAHEWLMKDALQQGLVQRVLNDYEATTLGVFDMTVHAVYLPMGKAMQRVKLFTDFLIEAFRDEAHKTEIREQLPTWQK